jgi:hypothetical protein
MSAAEHDVRPEQSAMVVREMIETRIALGTGMALVRL